MVVGKVKRGRKGQRIVYERGTKISMAVPKYIDDTTLLWINSQPQFATSVWELIRRAAHSETLLSESSLQFGNVPIEQILKMISANKDNIIKENLDAKGIENEEPKAFKEKGIDIQGNIDKIEEERKRLDELRKEEERRKLEEIALTQNEEKEIKVNDNLTSGSKEFNLNTIAAKKKGSTPLSRTTGVMTQLPGNKVNPMETGAIVKK